MPDRNLTPRQINARLASLYRTCINLSKNTFGNLYMFREITTLGELCVFPRSSGLNPKTGKKQGAYPFYCNSQLGCKFLDTYDTHDTEIILNKTGKTADYAVYLADGKYTVAKNTVRLKHPSRAMTIFIYYFLLSHKDLFFTVYDGINQKRINMKKFKNLRIPIGSEADQEWILRTFHDVGQQIRELESMR